MKVSEIASFAVEELMFMDTKSKSHLNKMKIFELEKPSANHNK